MSFLFLGMACHVGSGELPSPSGLLPALLLVAFMLRGSLYMKRFGYSLKGSRCMRNCFSQSTSASTAGGSPWTVSGKESALEAQDFYQDSQVPPRSALMLSSSPLHRLQVYRKPRYAKLSRPQAALWATPPSCLSSLCLQSWFLTVFVSANSAMRRLRLQRLRPKTKKIKESGAEGFEPSARRHSRLSHPILLLALF